MLPSFANLNHQLASRFIPAVDPVLPKLNTELELKFVDVITFHSSLSMSYLKPNVSYASILSIKSSLSVLVNVVVKLGNIADIAEPSGTTLLSVTGPRPESKFPKPPLAPSALTAPIFTHSLSSALSVPNVTSVLFKNSLVSGDVHLINAPTFAYFILDVAKSPTTKAPPDVKYPVLVLVPVVVDDHVAVNELKSLVPYFK